MTAALHLPEVEAALAELDAASPVDIDPADVAQWFDTAAALDAYAKRFADAAALIRMECGRAVPAGEQVVSEGRAFKRTASASRRGWDHEALVRAVMDARRVNRSGETVTVHGVEYAPGDVIEDTPAQRLMDVYGCQGYKAKIGALKALEIDPDEYCQTEWTPKGVREIPTEEGAGDGDES